MAASTGIVLTAGALAELDIVINDWNPGAAAKVAVGTVAAAFVSAGLDRLLPGWGTGLAVLLLLGAVLTNVPRIVKTVFPT
jgi:hypothetical protein